jgi:hypothetical protein
MKIINSIRATLTNAGSVAGYFGLVMAGLLPVRQAAGQQVAAFEVISRQPLTGNKSGRVALSGDANGASIVGENRQGKLFYRVEGNGVQGTVPALTHVEVAPNGSRIWVYGDSARRHVVDNVYASVYSSTGSLIKTVGKLGNQPYASAIANNGSLVFAGNPRRDGDRLIMELALYDGNGNGQWRVSLPEGRVSQVFVSADCKYIAAVHFNNQTYVSSTLVYDGGGRLLQTLPHNADGVDFLSSGKLILSDGRGWFLYDLRNNFRLLHRGTLPDNALGKFPVTAHPSRDIFYVLSADAAAKGVRLQAYDGQTGRLLAQGSFRGKDSWQPYRQVALAREGSIRLMTGEEVITLGMK